MSGKDVEVCRIGNVDHGGLLSRTSSIGVESYGVDQGPRIPGRYTRKSLPQF